MRNAYQGLPKPLNNMLFITSRSRGRFLEKVTFNLYIEAKKKKKMTMEGTVLGRRNLLNSCMDFTQGMVGSVNSMFNFRQFELKSD